MPFKNGQEMAKSMHTILNGLVSADIGSTVGTVTDTASFVSTGNFILSSEKSKEYFLNTLMWRIFETRIRNRAYTSPFRSFVVGATEYGAVLQKISVDLPDFAEEVSIKLENGQSIDHYKVNKPKAYQTLFYSETPYKLWQTFQDQWLKSAFLNEQGMASFISAVWTSIGNAMELGIEALGRACLTANIVNTYQLGQDSQKVHLVTEYNSVFGTSLTSETAMQDESFLNWATGYIQEIGNALTMMSVNYNTSKLKRFTPVGGQRLIMLNRFRTFIDHVARANIFHDNYLSLVEDMLVPYWQYPGNDGKLTYDTISTVQGTVGDSNEEVTVNNLVAVMMDKESMGIYERPSRTATTPLNADGLYYNVFFHENKMFFNMLDENVILFLLD